MFLLRDASFFLKISIDSHSVVNEVNVNLKNGWHYLWLCHSKAIHIHVHEVMPLVTLVVLQWLSLVVVTLRYVYEACLYLSQLWGVNDSETKAVLPVKQVFSWQLLSHSSLDLLSKALPPRDTSFLGQAHEDLCCRAAHSIRWQLLSCISFKPLAEQLLCKSWSCLQEQWPYNWMASQHPRILEQ